LTLNVFSPNSSSSAPSSSPNPIDSTNGYDYVRLPSRFTSALVNGHFPWQVAASAVRQANDAVPDCDLHVEADRDPTMATPSYLGGRVVVNYELVIHCTKVHPPGVTCPVPQCSLGFDVALPHPSQNVDQVFVDAVSDAVGPAIESTVRNHLASEVTGASTSSARL
jgi:hypothetical protein